MLSVSAYPSVSISAHASVHPGVTLKLLAHYIANQSTGLYYT